MTGAARIWVCFAVEEEARPFRAWAVSRPEIRVLVSGMGARNARCCVREALAGSKPELLITCGFAGGLNPELTPGTVLYPLDTPPERAARFKAAGARPGRLHCAGRVVSTADGKRDLREQTGADAVEMESGVIGEVCAELGVPAITVRAILDPANEDLPLDFNELLDDQQQMVYSRLALTLAKAPGKIPALLRLRRESNRVASELAGVLIRALS